MGEALDALKGKLGLDTSDFKTGVSTANRELRLLESGFRASTASLGDWSKTATGLEARMKTLSSAIEIQKAKAAATREEWERVKNEKGENSRAAQELEIKLNKEIEALGKNEAELRQNSEALSEMENNSKEAAGAVEDTGSKSKESGGKLEGFKTTLHGVGVAAKATAVAVAAIAGAAMAAGGAVIGLALKSAAAADDLMDLSIKTGYSTDQLQEMKYAGEILGTDIDTITSANTKLIRSMEAAREGTGEQAEVFERLGISVTDVNGNLRSSQDVFAEAIDVLGAIENPTERDAAAMALMGKSAQELNPLIAAGSDEFARLSAEAHNVGAVVDGETVTAAANFQDELDGLKMGVQGVGMSLGAAFLPGLTGVLDMAKGYMSQLVGVVNGSDGDMGKIAEGLGGLFTTIAKDLAGQLPKMLQAGMAIVQGILNAIIAALPNLIEAAIQIIMMLIEFLVQNLPLLFDAAIQILLALVNGITKMLPTLIPAIVQVVLTMVMTLIENLPLLVEAAVQLILALVQGLMAALPILIEMLPEIIVAIVDALITSLPLIIKAALQIIIALAEGLMVAIPVLITAVGELFKGLVETFKNKDWASIGNDMIAGVAEGFMAKWEAFKTNVKEAVAGLVTLLKTLLGIESPSKVFAGIGKNMALGLGSGFLGQFGDVERSLANAFGGLVTVSAGGYMGSGMAMSNENENYTFYAPVIIQGGDASGLGNTIKSKRF